MRVLFRSPCGEGDQYRFVAFEHNPGADENFQVHFGRYDKEIYRTVEVADDGNFSKNVEISGIVALGGGVIVVIELRVCPLQYPLNTEAEIGRASGRERGC